MKTYILRRLLLMLPTLLGVSIVTFVIVNLVPGGPVEQAMTSLRFGGMGGEAGGGSVAGSSNIDEDYLNALKEYYGFDKPLLQRYFIWISKVVRGDFGESYFYEEPVLDVILSRLPVSMTFGFATMFLIYFVCVPLGIVKAVKHRTAFDNISSALIFMGYSIPGYALLIILLVLFGGGTWLNWFPLQGFTSGNFDELSLLGKVLDILHHMALPLIAYSVTLLAFNTMLMKNSLIEQLTADYVRTAYAKGLSSKVVIFGHALRNALIPIATGIGRFMTFFLAGSILIETIAGLDGVGRLAYESLLNRDYPVALGFILISSFLYVLGQLLADLAYVLVDPRIDFS